MLNRLFVKNVALIDSLEIDFSQGLNVISGETGAGKSIIVDSVNLALGERADRELIRTGTASAFVEAVFDMEDRIAPLMEEYGLPTDDVLIITRELFPEGKNVCRINGRTVTLSSLREITGALVDMHGQHEHQELLNPNYHLSVLDTFAADSLTESKNKVESTYRQYKEICAESDKLYADDGMREQRIDILSYQINEIEGAGLTVGEDEQLRDRRRLIQNSEKIARSVEGAKQALDGNGGAVEWLNRAIHELGKVSEFDESLSALYERLQSGFYEISDISAEIRNFSDAFDFDNNELDEIEERIELINKLNRKYGGSIEAVLEFYDSALVELDNLKNSEAKLAKLKKEKKACQERLFASSLELSKKRKQAAQEFEEKLSMQVKELGMPSACFEIQFNQLPENYEEAHFTANGLDSVVFMFSANKGEPVKQLSKIASGGEMSRLMLAIKTIMAKHFGVSTMIFDEIDTGISGKMAHAVAHKLCSISRDKQVICITHLPQIAAMGDTHYLITKIENATKTVTTLEKLDENGVVKEIARLAGAIDSQQSATYAKEIINEARAYKGSLAKA